MARWHRETGQANTTAIRGSPLTGRSREHPLYTNPARCTVQFKVQVVADGGGSNGSRVKLWKVGLQRLANELAFPLSICHLPPGTSKWNKIEHRLFSHITMNWRGKPLISHEVIVNLIQATTTRTGLKVHCELDTNIYPDIAGLQFLPRQVLGQHNAIVFLNHTFSSKG
jgi:hypothetical protein